MTFPGKRDPNEAPSGAALAPNPDQVNEFHRYADTDASPDAQHHTLGVDPNQSSPGDHNHDGRNSAFLSETSHIHPGLTPVGSITMYGGGVAPTGWLLCNGAAVSRTEFANLFNAIGASFGAGDGTTTFNVPNFQAQFPVGVSGTAPYTMGGTGGAASVALAVGDLPPHNHPASASSSSSSSTSIGASGGHAHSASGSSDSQGGHGHGGSTSAPGNHSHSVTHHGNATNVGSEGHNHTRAFGTGLAARHNLSTSTASEGTTANGDHTHSITADAVAGHTHGISVGIGSVADHGHSASTSTSTSTSVSIGNTGSGAAHENRPPFLAVNFIIKT